MTRGFMTGMCLRSWTWVLCAIGMLAGGCTSGDGARDGHLSGSGSVNAAHSVQGVEEKKQGETLAAAAGTDAPVTEASAALIRFGEQPIDLSAAFSGPFSPASSKLRLVWISLDGLQRQMVEGFLSRTKQSHPFGLRFLLNGGAARTVNWDSVQVTDPTITSSSHASTITCSPPGVHGIVSNGQWNGKSMESGFDKPYSSETFVHALRDKGLRVGVVGYPGFDAQTPNRTADLSISYDTAPDQSQLIDLTDKPRGAVEWVSRLAGESGQVISVRYQSEPGSDRVRIQAPLGEAAFVDETKWLNVLSRGVNRSEQVALTVFRKDGHRYLYVSPSSVNKVLPSVLEKSFEDNGLIFSAGKDYAVRSRMGDAAFLRTMGHRLFYFVKSMHTVLNDQSTDALFLYFEDLDVLGHQYAGQIGALPLIDAHLAQFDRALGSILSRLPVSTNLVVAGDHGMSVIQYELNPMAFLPQPAREKLVVRSSGGSLFLYGSDPRSLTELPPAGEKWFRALVAELEGMRLPSDPAKRLFPSVVVRGSAAAQKAGWKDQTALPWVIAYATPGVGIKTMADKRLVVSKLAGVALPEDALLAGGPQGQKAADLPEPVPAGQHGHVGSSPEMLTHVILSGPAFKRNGLRRQSDGQGPLANTILVPRVADALRWPRPEGCR